MVEDEVEKLEIKATALSDHKNGEINTDAKIKQTIAEFNFELRHTSGFNVPFEEFHRVELMSNKNFKGLFCIVMRKPKKNKPYTM